MVKIMRWLALAKTRQLFFGDNYEGSIYPVGDKWHMGMAGSNGPYDAIGQYQYIFDDFETAKLMLEQRVIR